YNADSDNVFKGYRTTTYVLPLNFSGTMERVFLIINKSTENEISLNTPFTIEDIGFYKSGNSYLYDNRLFMKYIPHDLFVVKLYYVFFILVAVSFVSLLLMTGIRRPRIIIPVYIFMLAVSFICYELYIGFPPDRASEDLRYTCSLISLEGGGSNLNWGLTMAKSFLSGNGLIPYWNRMPGYGLMSAIAGITAGDHTNLALMGLHMIFFHLVFFVIALTYFVWAAMKIMNHRLALIIAMVICFLPNQFFYTQADSIMISIALLISGTLILYLNQRNSGNKVSFWYYFLIHTVFALWFFVRPDVLPAWMVISIVLHRRSWRYYLIPIVFFLMIGLPWGIHKKKNLGEFKMTTSSVGLGLFVGLWELPHKFIWEPSDACTFQLGTMLNRNVTDNKGSKFLTNEVIRFYCTYPGYLVSLLWHEFIQYAFYQSVPGYSYLTLQMQVRSLLLKFSLPLIYLATICLSFVYHYKVFQTFLLSWSVFFTLPFFFFLYSSAGRFNAPHIIALLTCTVPLLFDKEFYLRIIKKPRPAIVIIFLVGFIYIMGEPIDNALLNWDAFRYMTPFLDPMYCIFNVFK
ncbi:hypothetical protein ACFL47_01050, partial [Candidatus Latescibacterota bacterium]